MFKIALNAGHYINEPGKRCLKSLDPGETREWVLNDRICDKVEQKLKRYSGYELLRTDDTSGKTNYSISARAKKANDFGADIYVAVHHNAGIGGGSGGGIMAFVYLKVDEKTKRLQNMLYDKLIAKTGLRGNRSQPLAAADLGECRETRMPAVLLECGFMDSSTDVPVILSEDFAEKCAEAITEAVAEFGGLVKKSEIDNSKNPENSAGLYFVQVGAYSKKENALAMVQKLKNAGFDAIIKQ